MVSCFIFMCDRPDFVGVNAAVKLFLEGVYTPVAVERVRKHLNREKLGSARCTKVCGRVYLAGCRNHPIEGDKQKRLRGRMTQRRVRWRK